MKFNRRKVASKLGIPIVLVLFLTGLSAAVWKAYDYSPLDKEFYLTSEQLSFVRPGLNIEITDYAIEADGTVWAEFTMVDDGGLPLDMAGVYTPGPIRISLMLAYIPQDSEHYVSYTTSIQTSPITGDSAEQATADSGGEFEEIEIGTYRYIFSMKVPSNYDRNATHTLGFYAERNLEEWELGAPMDDGVVTFVPSGGDIEKIRDIVTNEACARCHDPLRLHGRRHSYELCILCHYDGVIDPDTGNTVDFKVMVHKIHYGEELPSVQAGIPYQIIGYRQSVHDYSEVAFPQDHRNCETCHAEEASQYEAYALNPTRAACGSCHDDVVWATGENHVGGPQVSDNFCANCHYPEGELEFDSSVKGAHTIESKSKQLAGLNVEILDVTNSAPGQAPTVLFSLKNDDGSPVDMADMDRVRFLLAGPTDDYDFQVRETATDASVALGDGEYTYTFETTIPEDAEGSFAIGSEVRRNVLLNPGTTREEEYREQARNTPVFAFPVTDSEAVARRMIVASEKCNECHDDLAFHGSNRRNPAEYCQMCHRPVEVEEEGRSVDFKLMIHRIHTGEELENEYTVGGRNYNGLLYPGDRRNCEKCHVDESYEEAQGNLDTVSAHEFFDPMPMPPNTTACTGCHDTLEMQAHAYMQIAPFGEACMACHGPGKEFSVARSHAR